MPYIGNNHIAGDHTNNFKVLDDISSYTATFDATATSVVDITNNTIRLVEHRFIQGQRVTYSNGSSSSAINVAVTVGVDNVGGQATGVFYLDGAEKPANFALHKGNTYIFDQSDNSNEVYGGANHPLMFSTGPDGDHNSNGHYMSGVVYKLDGVVKTMMQYTSGFNAATTRTVEWTIPANAPAALYYWCHHHTGQGNSFAVSGTAVSGLTSGTAYYVIKDTANTIKLATSASNAATSTAINLTAVGTGTTHSFNAAFDGVNTKFKLTYRDGKAARFNNATQINVAINNVVQRPNLDPNTFTEGFALEDHHKIIFKNAPTANDIFWGSIIANTLPTFDISDHEVDTFTGDGTTTEFTLSHTPANNESLMVSINGVLQHPSDGHNARAYSLNASIIEFTAAPGNGDEIQVRHMGFAGAVTNDVSGFYGRTGNVVLGVTDNISIGDISTSRNINATGIITAASFRGDGSQLTGIDATALKDTDGNVKIQAQASGAVHTGIATFQDIDVDGHTNLDNLSVAGVSTFGGAVNFSSGHLSAQSASFTGNVSVGGTLTYEDVTNVDSVGLGTFRDGLVVQTGSATTAMIVEGNARITGIMSVGTGTVVIDETTVKTGSSNLHSVGLEVVQINVLGGATKIGSGVTITNDGNYESIGISTALQFKTGTTNVHNVGIEVAQLNVLGGATKIGSGATIYADGGFESIGVATATNFKTGTTNVHNVGVELAGINVLGADTPIGAGSTIFNSGQIVSQAGAEIAGIVTATTYYGDGSNLTGITAAGTGAIGGLTVKNESGAVVGTAGSISSLDFNGSSGVTVTATSGAAGIATVAISAELVSDTSPQLGGNLDLNSKSITGSANLTGQVSLTSSGSYPLDINGSSDAKIVLRGSSDPYIRFREADADKAYIQWNASGYLELRNQEDNSKILLRDDIVFSSDGSTLHKIWHAGNDGSGSGLDSDTVDGLQASSFVRSDADDTMNGQLIINTSNDEHIILQGSTNPYIRLREGTTNRAYLQFNGNGNVYLWNDEVNRGLQLGSQPSFYDGSYQTIWHAGNDGSGSGLDSDTVDGIQASSFLRSDANDSASGSYNFTNSYNAFGNSTGSVSNNGSWNARLNLAGSNHARFDVQSVSDGIITTMYSHNGHNAGRVGTYSNHKLILMANAQNRAELSTSGSLSTTVQGTLWGSSNDGSGSGLDADTVDGQQRTGFVEHNTNSHYILRFGSGTNSGHSSSSYPYAIFQESGAWSGSYPDLRINYHTGIIMAVGHSGYGGLRFQRDYNDATELMSIGNGDNHVRIANNLYISGTTQVHNAFTLEQGGNNRNMKFRTTGTGDIGISGYDGNNTWMFQLYGTSGSYGFLNGNWSGWDLKKTVNSDLQINVSSSMRTVWHTGNLPSYDTGANANTLVRRDGSGHIQANHFYSVCGDMGSTLPDRFYCSNDNYHRKVDLYSMASMMNRPAKSGYYYGGREQSTSDTNYWVGSMGWGAHDFNTLFNYGSGSIDVWSNPGNQPSGTSHWVGSQHLHYTNQTSGSGTGQYGHQIVVGAGNPDLMYVRGVWGGGFTSWKKMLNEGNYSGVLSSSSILYIDVYSTGSTSDRNTANSWAQSAVSIPNDCLYIVRYYYTHSYWVGNHTGTSHEDRRTVFYKNSSGSTYWAGVDRS